MRSEYEKWITAFCSRNEDALLGKCREAVAEMIEAFPELVEVRGHVLTVWGKRGHIWCRTPDGEIIDPTQAQFPSIFEYEPWVPGAEVMVGRCMNCGVVIWRSVESLEEEPARESICDETCARAFDRDLRQGRDV